MNHPLSSMMGASIDKIREMVDVNTVTGDPIVTPDGVTIIPISTVKVGYAGGGSDFTTKNNAAKNENPFGGGVGASVTVTPTAFLVIKGESVRVLPVTTPPSGSIERLVEMQPDLIDQLAALGEKNKKTEFSAE